MFFFLSALQPLPQAGPGGGDPGTQITSIFDGQPQQDKAELPIKTRGPIWVLGEYKNIYIYIYIYIKKYFTYMYVSFEEKREKSQQREKSPTFGNVNRKTRNDKA